MATIMRPFPASRPSASEALQQPWFQATLAPVSESRQQLPDEIPGFGNSGAYTQESEASAAWSTIRVDPVVAGLCVLWSGDPVAPLSANYSIETQPKKISSLQNPNSADTAPLMTHENANQWFLEIMSEIQPLPKPTANSGLHLTIGPDYVEIFSHFFYNIIKYGGRERGKDRVTRTQAMDIFRCSDLTVFSIRNIWKTVDRGAKGYLNRPEFILAMHAIQLIISGWPLSVAIPPTVDGGTIPHTELGPPDELGEVVASVIESLAVEHGQGIVAKQHRQWLILGVPPRIYAIPDVRMPFLAEIQI